LTQACCAIAIDLTHSVVTTERVKRFPALAKVSIGVSGLLAVLTGCTNLGAPQRPELRGPAMPSSCRSPLIGNPTHVLRWSVANGDPTNGSCFDAPSKRDQSVRGLQRVSGGTNTDVESAVTTTGLWITDLTGGDAHLLVEHGDALEVFEPAFSPSGESVYFIARHPDHYEMHRLDTKTFVLDTLFESKEPLRALSIEPVGETEQRVAVQVGLCSSNVTPDVAIVQPNLDHGSPRDPSDYRVTLVSDLIPSLRDKRLSVVGWTNHNAGFELAILVRDDECEGPAELWLPQEDTGAVGQAPFPLPRALDVAQAWIEEVEAPPTSDTPTPIAVPTTVALRIEIPFDRQVPT
jgi:hypothetical protein